MSPSSFSQMFPPSPGFTEKQLPDLAGKVSLALLLSPKLKSRPQVYIVTGSTSRVGYELASLLYGANATVYLAARSEVKLSKAVATISATHTMSKGALHTLNLDTSNLTTIKPAVEAFLSRESRLDVLFDNAGVMMPSQGSLSMQGFDLKMSTDCLGPYLLTKLLTPILKETAKKEKLGVVRVVWVTSMLAGVAKAGIEFDSSGRPRLLKDMMNNYM